MKNKVNNSRIYLDTYVIQKDNRIRLPKAIEENMGAIPGETNFDIYLDVNSNEIVLKISSEK